MKIEDIVNPVIFGNMLSLDADLEDHKIIDGKKRDAAGPCASSRAIAMAHVAMADTCVAFGAKYHPLIVKNLTAASNSSLNAAVASAAYVVLKDIYNQQNESLTKKFNHYIATLEKSGDLDIEAGKKIGENVGKLVLENRKTDDVYNKLFSDYSPKHEPGYHDEDPFHKGQGFYGATWGTLKPFVLSKSEFDDCIVKERPKLDNEEYNAAYKEVENFGHFDPKKASRTEEQTITGIFWAYDGANAIGTPPRLYNQFILEVLKSDEVTDTFALAKILALTNLALVDAGIVCWAGKYKFEFWRPVLGINYGKKEGDEKWEPLGAQASRGEGAVSPDVTRGLGFANPSNTSRKDFTPNFPSYPSGHATFGSACLNVLIMSRSAGDDLMNVNFQSDEYNGKTKPSDGNEPRPSVIRPYRKISDAIKENEDSRIFLGVHWRFDQTDGVESGEKIAKYIVRSAYQKI